MHLVDHSIRHHSPYQGQELRIVNNQHPTDKIYGENHCRELQLPGGPCLDGEFHISRRISFHKFLRAPLTPCVESVVPLGLS